MFLFWYFCFVFRSTNHGYCYCDCLYAPTILNYNSAQQWPTVLRCNSSTCSKTYYASCGIFAKLASSGTDLLYTWSSSAVYFSEGTHREQAWDIPTVR